MPILRARPEYFAEVNIQRVILHTLDKVAKEVYNVKYSGYWVVCGLAANMVFRVSGISDRILFIYNKQILLSLQGKSC